MATFPRGSDNDYGICVGTPLGHKIAFIFLIDIHSPILPNPHMHFQLAGSFHPPVLFGPTYTFRNGYRQ